MKLSLNEIKEITLGAAVIEETEKGISFNRFTKEQTEIYKNRCDEFYMKSLSASGIRMWFQTDSETLFLKAEMQKGSSRTYFAFELLIDGKRVDTLDNYTDFSPLPADYTKLPYPTGEFSKEFSLGKGLKEVCLYFPWSASVVIKEFSLNDNSVILPKKPEKKILCFGDSITQGYDALYPGNKYITKFAESLGAEEFNKAIGGEVFFPELAASREDFVPDYITVAYGTNDWFKTKKEDFCKNCKAFFQNLAGNYPGVKTLVITPIWRKDLREDIGFGPFEEVDQIIRETVKDYENITVVSGFDFLDHDEAFFGDLRLHPNDEGFAQYFESLVRKVSF